MKNLKQFIITLCLFLFLGAYSLMAQTVYVTESGKKYHAKNCDIVKTGKKGMELADAKKAGYTPCAKCKAPDAAAAPKPKAKK